jgi:cellulose synthase/poly-beta-1,6-N-acetylglucosamine synthase-like glycosyltransferase
LIWLYIGLVCTLLIVYIWSFYNLPILVAGVKSFRESKQKSRGKSAKREALPVFSIIVPVKNEEKVLGRLLNALTEVRYPSDKKEIIVVEDGSTDRSVDVCEDFARKHSLKIRIVQRPFSDGKPSALNAGITCAKGEIVGVFDADNVPASDVLLNVCKYFRDPQVAAVQGRTLSINSEENMLTRMISQEEDIWYETYLRGKDALNLFVHLKGSCQFIRRDILEKVEGFDENALSEDMELSAKTTEKGYKIKYAPDVRSWQESPCDLKQLFRQRVRWYRGTMEVAIKYGRLIAKPSKKSFDAEVTLFGPFVLILSLLAYVAGSYVAFMPFPLGNFLYLVMEFTFIIATATVFACGIAFLYSSKPKKTLDLLWVPFIYAYWSAQAFIAFYAMLLIILRRPRKWLKTNKKGTISCPASCTPSLIGAYDRRRNDQLMLCQCSRMRSAIREKLEHEKKRK